MLNIKGHTTELNSIFTHYIYKHGNKLGNTCNNVTTNFGRYISFFVKIMKNVLTICQNL